MIFDQPTAVSMIKIWNYSKTANRGAKDIAVSLLLAQSKVSLSIFTMPESKARNPLKIIKCPIFKHKFFSSEKISYFNRQGIQVLHDDLKILI